MSGCDRNNPAMRSFLAKAERSQRRGMTIYAEPGESCVTRARWSEMKYLERRKIIRFVTNDTSGRVGLEDGWWITINGNRLSQEAVNRLLRRDVGK